MYAITRLGRKVHTVQELIAIQSHNSRLAPVAHLTGPARAVQLAGTGILADDIGSLLPVKRRKNAVLAVEMLYTASPEYFRPLAPQEVGVWDNERLQEWQDSTTSYLLQRWGNRLASATLHLDESTPHIHAIIVPLDSRGKLNCRDVFNRAALIDNQTSYAAALQPLGLLRGLEGSKAKHEDIKQYYKRISAPTPTLVTPRPDQSDTSLLASAKRALGLTAPGIQSPRELEAMRVQRARELKAQRDVERAKAGQFDAMQRRVSANTDLIANLRREAATIRELPMEPILEKLGATRSIKDKNNWETSVGRITIEQKKFFNHGQNLGGGGAIDLVMHVAELSFKEALAWLGGNLGLGPAIGAAMAHAKAAATLAAATPLKEFTPPLRFEGAWPKVRNYLIRQRHIDASIVDSAYEVGLIYADKYSNLVFLNSTHEGCELRGTENGNFHGQRGKKSPVILPALTSNKAALVESGIDALSLRALGFNGMILSFGGQAKNLLTETVQELHEQGWEIISAFDNDVAGNAMATDVDLALTALAQPTRLTPIAKDWNDDLAHMRQIAQRADRTLHPLFSKKDRQDPTP